MNHETIHKALMFKVDDEVMEMIKISGLFDEPWYLGTYPDVAKLGMDPVVHYLWIGGALGRNPSPSFSGQAYLSANPDVKRAEHDPFVHYVTTGRHENRPTQLRPVDSSLSSNFSSKKRKHFGLVENPAARVITFYLPQFHTFDENNTWWGEGFTEWTNVRPAIPQFLGHYQPHEPHDDIGYYDLLDGKTFKKQIDIARSHGVTGFCFYYYWFGGKRLMEKAIDAYLDDQNLDFPFCLCWANENWTRRWDGLDSEVLIAQKHSPADDLDCIKDLARYIRDERYIRIEGKPLVLVYRPALLPDAAATANRWRVWCRENGIGEIYLAYTQSFEDVDPVVYGFDAAIEFPPNNTGPTDMTATVVPSAANFDGNVYDWGSLANRSYTYKYPPYRQFRAVCPGWDNTARRKNSGSILVHNTPDVYEAWLSNAVRDTVLRFEKPDERLVFVNAWNEWAEGAHLEPDQRDGYAYLEATRRAIDIRPEPPKLAVAIHAFYPEVLPEIIGYVDKLPNSVELFVTTTKDKIAQVKSILKNQAKPFQIITTENRGRDVLPFLQVLKKLVDQKFDHVAKIHTKRSLHRDDGNDWRRELYDAIVGADNFYRSVVALESDHGLGLLGPKGHLVSMDTYLGSNLDRIRHYSKLLGIDTEQLLDYAFFAGTMFVARVSALEPILHLGITDQDFELEVGQIDGTLAHVIERIIGLAVSSQRYRISFTAEPQTLAPINRNYGFA